MVDEIKRLREVKARLEAENQQQALALKAIKDAEAPKKAAALEEAHTEAALAAEVQALQQTKLQLEDDIRKASLRGHFLRKVDQRKSGSFGVIDEWIIWGYR